MPSTPNVTPLPRHAAQSINWLIARQRQRRTCGSKPAAHLVQGHRDMDVLVGVHADRHSTTPSASSCSSQLLPSLERTGRRRAGRPGGRDCDETASDQAPMRSLPARPAPQVLQPAGRRYQQPGHPNRGVSRKQESGHLRGTHNPHSRSSRRPIPSTCTHGPFQSSDRTSTETCDPARRCGSSPGRIGGDDDPTLRVDATGHRRDLRPAVAHGWWRAAADGGDGRSPGARQLDGGVGRDGSSHAEPS